MTTINVSNEDHDARLERLTDAETLKENMRTVRMSHEEMTPETIARVLGITPRTVRRYDDPRDKSMPTLLQAVRVAQYFGISLDYMVDLHRNYHEDESDLDSRFERANDWLKANATPFQKQLMLDVINQFLAPTVAYARGMDLDDHASVRAIK